MADSSLLRQHRGRTREILVFIFAQRKRDAKTTAKVIDRERRSGRAMTKVNLPTGEAKTDGFKHSSPEIFKFKAFSRSTAIRTQPGQADLLTMTGVACTKNKMILITPVRWATSACESWGFPCDFRFSADVRRNMSAMMLTMLKIYHSPIPRSNNMTARTVSARKSVAADLRNTKKAIMESCRKTTAPINIGEECGLQIVQECSSVSYEK
jgi:hypothetical protein